MHTQYKLKLVNFQLFSSHQIINVLESHQSVSPLTSMHIYILCPSQCVTGFANYQLTNCGSLRDGFANPVT